MNDLISRQAAIDALGERPHLWGDCDYNWGRVKQYESDKEAIETVPSAPQCRENIHGEWLMSDESKLRPYMCSNCGCLYDVDTVMGKIVWQFCPNCGAQMEEKGECK